MAITPGADPLGAAVNALQPIDRFFETKLRPPPRRDNWVHRCRLMDAMALAARRPVTLVAAPAGYGKTTVVAQWLYGEDRQSAAWVSLDRGDNDSDHLWTHVAAALERAGCPLPVLEPARGGGIPAEPSTALLLAILNALAVTLDDMVLVLDDFQFIQSPARHAEVEFFIENLPPQAHLVIVTRSDPGLRLGRLRVSNALAELRADDLAFTPQEAHELLAHEGVDLSEGALSHLMERTEGWPAALYLAALTLAGQSDPDDFVHRFSGDNRFIGDYLAEEVLSRHSDPVRNFLLRVSLLDRFSAPLCDHVAGMTQSATILRDLERDNLFLVPLDGDRQWFRFHHLFAAVARTELELTDPAQVPILHARAAEWFSSQGHVAEAIEHYLLADRGDDAARLVQAHWLHFADTGRLPTVLAWLKALGTVDNCPAALVTAAWIAASTGDETALVGHLDALDALGALPDGPLPDGCRSVESARSLIEGLFGHLGPLRMLSSAQRATELETDPQSPFYAMAHLALGHAWYVLGEPDKASASLSIASTNDRAPVLVRVLALSFRSLLESERGDTVRARECAESAMEVVDARGMRASPQSSPAFTALAQAQAAAGKADDAMMTLEVGLARRHQGNAQSVWGAIHNLMVGARVAAQLGHSRMARELLAELDMRMDRFCDGMEMMLSRRDALQRMVTAATGPDVLDDRLTERELALLRRLQGDLSLQEISAELYLSHNTVKTHARSVYRKLGAHSRAEAVIIARQRSLI